MNKTRNTTPGRADENNQVLGEILKIAAQPLPLETLLGQSLDVLLSLSWLSLLPKGGIFLSDKDYKGVDFLRLVAQRNLGEKISTLCAKVKFGYCLCGKVAQSKKPLHVSCVDHLHETRFDGMEPHGHYNIPILSGDNLLGVLVFYLPDGKHQDDEEVAFIIRAAGVFALMIELHSKEIELEKANRELRYQKDGLDEHAIVSISDVNGDITYVNDKFCDVSGYSREELLGGNHRIVKSGYHPESFYRNLWATITKGHTWHGEIKSVNKDGGFYWMNSTIVPFLDEKGVPYQYLAIRTDITEQKNTEEAFARAQSVANIGNWSFDVKNDKLIWSDQIYEIFGLDSDSVTANFPLFLSTIHPDDLNSVVLQYQNSIDDDYPYDIEHRIIRKDNAEVRWVHEKCVHYRDAKGIVMRSDGTVQDITERKHAQEEIHRLAMTDQLTGLANRNQFYRRFDEGMKLAKREEKMLVLMLLDLDNFKPVNDTYGHQVGDVLLKNIADIFIDHCRETDIVARFGGDEFAILLIHPESVSAAEQCAQRIIDEVNKPMLVAGHEVRIGVSIGISIFPGESDKQDELIHQADLALYKSKNSGRNNYHFYDPGLMRKPGPDSSF